jgi:phosphoesterase RecJ-like protein
MTDKTLLLQLRQISKTIKQSQTFFIAGHIRPDCDSLGSCLALYSVLKRLGKKAEVYCLDEIPDTALSIKNSSKIKREIHKKKIFDCAFILESSSLERIGNIISKNQAKKIINIDHHLINYKFGDINWIDPSSSSVSELLLRLFEFMKIKLNKDEAECLYYGLLTDTGGFRNSNTNAASHIAAAKLFSLGIEADLIHKKVFSKDSLPALKLLGCALSNMQTCFNGQISYMVLDLEMLKKCGASQKDADGISIYLLKLDGAKAGFIIKEEGVSQLKVSLRSIKDLDILKAAKYFGGGGHKNAAGFSIKGGISEAVESIKEVLKKTLSGYLR